MAISILGYVASISTTAPATVGVYAGVLRLLISAAREALDLVRDLREFRRGR